LLRRGDRKKEKVRLFKKGGEASLERPRALLPPPHINDVVFDVGRAHINYVVFDY